MMRVVKSDNLSHQAGIPVCGDCGRPLPEGRMEYARAQGGKDYREYSCSCGRKIKVWMEEK